MRYQLAIVLSLICGPVMATPVMADKPVETTYSTAISAIGRPHYCSSYYPAAAWKAHVEGTVLVEFVVTVEGGVRDIKVASSSGNRDLDDASVKCVSFWRYKPATKDTVPVEMPWKANVVWKIAPAREVQTAISCLSYRGNVPAPDNLGHTAVSFRVMQDGAVADVRIAQSSGNRAWDGIGVACTQARHFDMSIFTVPTDGLPGHLEMDWTGALAAFAPAPTSPPGSSATTGSK